METEIFVADYSDSRHAQEILELLDGYASSPAGGGVPLPDFVKENLVAEMAKIPNAFSVLCYVDGTLAGLVNCFVGFSTFKCKPLVNIHDVVVAERFRGCKLSQQLLDKVQRVAMERGCCKLTLEVLEGNEAAKKAYLNFGFEAYQLSPEGGDTLFWQKAI